MSPENRGIAPETLRAVGPLPPMPPLARSAVLVIILMLCFVFLASEMMEGDLARFDTAVLMAFRPGSRRRAVMSLHLGASRFWASCSPQRPGTCF